MFAESRPSSAAPPASEHCGRSSRPGTTNWLTPTESACSATAPSNPFRILLFQSMYLLTPFKSYSFIKVVHQLHTEFLPICRRLRGPCSHGPEPRDAGCPPRSRDTVQTLARVSCPPAQDYLLGHFAAFPWSRAALPGGTVRLQMKSVLHRGLRKRQLTELWGI